jgi:hypothetical protein
MLNRSAAQIRYTAAFCEWLQAIHAHKPPAADVPSRTLYLIPAFDEPEEAEEVVENVFEEIFRQELKTWLPDERAWPYGGLRAVRPVVQRPEFPHRRGLRPQRHP